MFFDRRECLSVFIFSVCLHYSLWIPSEMLCALHHWTAGKGAAPDPRMPVGHQHGVAGELKEIAFIFNFLQCWKTVVWRVILFFLVFHYHVISSLPSFVSCELSQAAWAVAVIGAGVGRQLSSSATLHVVQLWTGECWTLWTCWTWQWHQVQPPSRLHI